LTLDVRDIDDIKDALKLDQQARHPYLRDYNDYSVLSTINEACAIQIQYVEERSKAAIEANSVWTATGDDLDILVQDRGITRQEGTRATGEVTFRTASPTTVNIVIPLGTLVSANIISNVDGYTSDKLYFETTEVGTIAIGYTSAAVDVQAVETGTDGNVPAYAINSQTVYIAGISRVENVAPLTGGTEKESDDDLRDRYIYATDINGRATLPLMEQHIYDLETVRECQIYQAAPGEIEIIADSTTLSVTDDDVVDCIEENIAVGVVSRGKLLATIISGIITPSIGIMETGKLYVRVDSPLVTPNESFTLNYTTTTGLSRVATVDIPTGSVEGDIVVATLQNTSDLVVSVDNGTYTGGNSYSILGGLGTYPYLYLLPRKVLCNALINIVQTADPDPDLADKIENSVEAFLDSFYIGVDLEYSDLIQYIYKGHDSSDYPGEYFEGIDQITSVILTANGSSISGFGQTVSMANDQRIDPGTITVTLT